MLWRLLDALLPNAFGVPPVSKVPAYSLPQTLHDLATESDGTRSRIVTHSSKVVLAGRRSEKCLRRVASTSESWLLVGAALGRAVGQSLVPVTGGPVVHGAALLPSTLVVLQRP